MSRVSVKLLPILLGNKLILNIFKVLFDISFFDIIEKVFVSASNCTITTNSVVNCWGMNTYGILGDRKVIPSSSPIQNLDL